MDLGLKSENLSQRATKRQRLVPASEAQNPPKSEKSVPRAIQKVIIFLIGLKIDFWIDLVPTWLYLDPQNPPKIEVAWHSNPSKLGHGFSCCSLQDVGSNFIDFERQDNMAYITKIVKNYLLFFVIFGTSASVGCSVVGIIGCLISS